MVGTGTPSRLRFPRGDCYGGPGGCGRAQRVGAVGDSGGWPRTRHHCSLESGTDGEGGRSAGVGERRGVEDTLLVLNNP